MAQRLDIVIFGATGFTGKNTLAPVAKLTKANGRTLTWGVAGRSESKLKDVLAEMSKKTGYDFSDVPAIIADVQDEESLKKMASRARIIINTTGPYRFYGEAVVKACIDSGTHHVDVSGEPQYMENMQLKYNKIAMEKGVYIISACGFDSIPADLGMCFLQKKYTGTLNSVETFLEASEDKNLPGSSINYGTWESAVYGLAHWGELKQIRRKANVSIPKYKYKIQNRGNFHRNETVNKIAVPFLGSDRSVMLRSQQHFYAENKKRPVQVKTYLNIDSVLSLVVLVIMGGIFSLLCKFEYGRQLLLKHPKFFSLGFFSHEGPSEEKTQNTKFNITLIGEGWPDKLAEPEDEYATPPTQRVIAKVSGSNPGYGATTTAVTIAAVKILEESSKMPNKGGVYPPGAAFANTSMIEELQENGLSFELLSTQEIISSHL